jgi:ubiquinone/menaquinone biosynthesis C-methylase UbiE
MAKPLSLRSFSTDKHMHGQWDTHIVRARNPLIRAAVSYSSFKRASVDKLAKITHGGFVLDAGCGKGAYSRWYMERRPAAVCIAVDWSEAALRRAQTSTAGRILRVCADVRFLPFQSSCMDALFSIDTLGHIDNCPSALDEFSRVCKSGAFLFVHSECRDYQKRWPDKRLMKQLGEDMLARYDGHDFIKLADELYALYSRRFHVLSFINPAGYCGFFLGYPEKYKMAFKKAGWHALTFITSILALMKRAPFLGLAIRYVNAFTNHCEVFFGLKGGGSCFAMMKKP